MDGMQNSGHPGQPRLLPGISTFFSQSILGRDTPDETILFSLK